MRILILLASGFWLLASLPACEEPTVRPNRAVASPVGTNSPERETLGDQPAGAVGVPLITIDMPKDKDDTVHVHTLGQNLTPATSTAPATAPAVQRTGTINLTPTGTPPAQH